MNTLAALGEKVAAAVRRTNIQQLTIVFLSLSLGIVIGRLLAGHQSPLRPVSVTDSPPTHEPATMSVTARRDSWDSTETDMVDWADSVPVPGFVLQPGLPVQPLQYQPTTSGAVAARSGSPSGTTLDPASVRAVAVVRVSGATVASFDVGLGPSETARPDAWSSWAILGECTSVLNLSGPWPAGRGQVRGGLGEWFAGLAVPERACRAFSGRVVPKRGATAILRRELAYAVQTEPAVRAVGAPAFRENDLHELSMSGGTAWGVFKASTSTTRIYPPPPRPQLAFVATRVASGDWRVLWTHYVSSSSEALGLAGVVDLQGTGVHEAFFGLRNADGSAELLQVAQADDAWELTRRIRLGRLLRR